MKKKTNNPRSLNEAVQLKKGILYWLKVQKAFLQKKPGDKYLIDSIKKGEENLKIIDKWIDTFLNNDLPF